MPVSLATIAQEYLSDAEFRDERNNTTQARQQNLPMLRHAIEDFLNDVLDLPAFRNQIGKAMPSKEPWGLRGADFLGELNKLVKNHAINSDGSKNGEITRELRELLTGLDAQTLGQRIEQWYAYAQQERERFKRENRPANTNVFPGNSALIVSVFAHWLDWNGVTAIYYLSLRQGLKLLLDAGLLGQATGLRIERDRIVVMSDTDHQAAQRVIRSIAAAAPRLRETGPYWAEHFLFWLVGHPEVLVDSGEGENSTIRVLKPGPLVHIGEPRLSVRIAELRRHLLVDEQLVRRIYLALLRKHVILTGPPGTGKTELARYLPEVLWGSEGGEPTAYTAQVVTATDEWSVRTLIGGLTPRSVNGQVVYQVQYGHLSEAIRKNWASDPNDPRTWRGERVSINARSYVQKEQTREFRGAWLIIDEFNRAPIDLALGEALTSLGNGSGGTLRVPTDDGNAELPLPDDFRIIGTLNSFDRNYLNQISEALKRRFAFIEVLPPTRAQRTAEQGIVLHKALQNIAHLLKVEGYADGVAELTEYLMEIGTARPHIVTIGRNTSEVYELRWEVSDFPALQETFYTAWRIFEVIRIYRQLGTAQAIAFIEHLLLLGLMQGYTEQAQWNEALDAALCDTIVDQLQVLLPDELDVLYRYVRYGGEAETFANMYNEQLANLAPRRRKTQLEALSSIVDENERPYLPEEEAEVLAGQAELKVPTDILTKIFRSGERHFTLPQFARRLRVFRTERGL